MGKIGVGEKTREITKCTKSYRGERPGMDSSIDISWVLP